MTTRIHSRAIFLFRRDLRLEDNLGLLRACAEAEQVLPLFVLDPRQVDPEENPYFSPPAFQFMVESLEALDAVLGNRGARLHVAEGNAEAVLRGLLAGARFQALYFNRDYTPFARARDSTLKALCSELGVACHAGYDAMLARPQDVRTGSGEPYKVFGAFARKAREGAVARPRANRFDNFHKGRVEGLAGVGRLRRRLPVSARLALAQRGGRPEARARMRAFDFTGYGDTRDLPDRDGTSCLSAHLKFGTLSARELYWHVIEQAGERAARPYLDELYWREFYAHLLYWYPELLGTDMQEKYRRPGGGTRIEWRWSREDFTRWCEGRTGFPIVDAGMRQLAETGWMHNRVRMITASFLTKDLRIDWRRGERYFAQQLVDYDPASNNGGWQWAASTGADAQPYFRIFNPWTQQRKFDPDCVYIQRYLPELRSLEPARIHALETAGVPDGVDYPAAMLEHRRARAAALAMFRAAG